MCLTPPPRLPAGADGPAETSRWGRKETFETWLVVQIFRDWLAHRLNAAKAEGRPWDGSHFRVMRLGGEAYLPTEEVIETLKHYTGGAGGRLGGAPGGGPGRLGGRGRDEMAGRRGIWELGREEGRWEEVRGDLELLKVFAKGVVAGLCVCEGLCAGEGEAEEEGEDGGGGLKCTTVEREELPWASESESEAEEYEEDVEGDDGDE